MTTWFTSGKNKGKTTKQVKKEEMQKCVKEEARKKYTNAQLEEAAKARPGTIMKWATRFINPFKGKK